MASSTNQTDWNKMTLLESFQHDVLLLAPPPSSLRVPNIEISKKGQSTQKAKPPVIWFPRDVAFHTQRAVEILQRQRDALSESYLAAPYIPCVLNTESDMVQASALWLLHPVIKALQSEFPGRAVCRRGYHRRLPLRRPHQHREQADGGDRGKEQGHHQKARVRPGEGRRQFRAQRGAHQHKVPRWTSPRLPISTVPWA